MWLKSILFILNFDWGCSLHGIYQTMHNIVILYFFKKNCSHECASTSCKSQQLFNH